MNRLRWLHCALFVIMYYICIIHYFGFYLRNISVFKLAHCLSHLQQQPPLLSFFYSYDLDCPILNDWWLSFPADDPFPNPFPLSPASVVCYGSFSLTMTFAMWWNTSFTFSPFLAEVSKKVRPCYSARARPRSVSITLSGRSHLLATSTLATLELACWSICFSQFEMLLKVCWSVQSYTRIIPIAPL